MTKTKTETVLSALLIAEGSDGCRGVAGAVGLHEQAANEIRRLAAALADSRDALSQVAMIARDAVSRVARIASHRATVVLDAPANWPR